MTVPDIPKRHFIGRPLRNAHGSLPAVIVAAWCLQFAAQSCSRTQTGAGVTLLVATVLIAGWVSHLRARAAGGWAKFFQVATGMFSDIVRLAVATIACMLPLTLLLPTYSCMTPKAKAIVALLAASPARVEIGERAEHAKTLKGAGVGVVIDSQPGTAGLVTDDGTIIAMSEDPPAVFVLQPTLADGKVSWRCSGIPAALAPSSCR